MKKRNQNRHFTSVCPKRKQKRKMRQEGKVTIMPRPREQLRQHEVRQKISN